MKIIISFGVILLLLFTASQGLLADEKEKVSAKLYGYVKLDAIYETGCSSHGNYTLWAKRPGKQ